MHLENQSQLFKFMNQFSLHLFLYKQKTKMQVLNVKFPKFMQEKSAFAQLVLRKTIHNHKYRKRFKFNQPE